MMFTGHNTASTYGRLYHWDDHEDSMMWLMNGQGTRAEMGLLVLKMQEHLYRFLVHCCLHILQETREAAAADNTPIEPEPPAISMIEGPVYSLSDIAAAAPYSVPAKLDLGYLRELVAARRSDHFWSIREDPGYFESTILETKDHRMENLLDSNRRPHSLIKPVMTRELWRRVVTQVTLEASQVLEVWHLLLSQLHELMFLLKKYEGQLREDVRLPEDLLTSFLDLEFSLNGYVQVILEVLKVIAYSSPPMRTWCSRKPEENQELFEVLTVIDGDDMTQAKFIFLLNVLLDGKKRYGLDVLPILDMLERLAKNDPKSRVFFSSKVANTIADLSLLVECQRHIKLFQPWASTFETEANVRGDIGKTVHESRTKRMTQVKEAFMAIDTSLADPSDKKFYYPVEQRRTRETTLAMQKAEKKLDEYWSRIDRAVLRAVNSSKDGVWTCLLSPDRKLQRTLDWIDPAFKAAAKERKKKVAQVVDLIQGLELRSESTIDNKETAQQQKSKIKTRGTTATADATADATAATLLPPLLP